MDAKNLALKLFFDAKDAASSVINKIRSSLSQASAETDKFGKANRSASADSTHFSASLGGLAGQLGAVAASYLSLNGLKSALESILQTGGKFETIGIQMRSVMGSVADGDAAFKWVKDFAKNTPLDLEGVSQAFVKLKAFGLDPMDGTLQAVTDQTSKLGGSQETLNGIVLALGQAWAKQKLQTEEINQLVERGVPVWEMLSNVTGKNAAELAKMAESGQLGRDTIKGLIDEIGRSSEGSSQAMMSSWTGLMSNLGDTWSQFLDRIAQSGLMDYFKSQLQDLLRSVEEMANNGQLQQIAQQISDFFVGAAATFRDAVSFIRDYANEFKALATIIIGAKIADAVSLIGNNAIKAAEGIGSLTGSMGKLAGVARAGLYAGIANEILNIAKAYEQTKAIEAKTAGNQQELAEKTALLKQNYAELSQELGITIQSMKDLDQAVSDGKVAFNEQTGEWEKTTQALRDYDAEVANAANNQEQIVGAFGKTISEMQNIGQASEAALAQFREWGQGATGSIDGIANSLSRLSGTELAQMKTALTEAFNTGINRTQELNNALASINSEEVDRAYKTLGVESSQSIQKAANDAKQAYETIKNSGSATAEDLAKAWDAYIAKIQQSNQALAGAKGDAGLNQLDTMGTDPAQESANRRQRLTQETIAYEKAMRDGDYQEAARIAQQKQELALENAKAEKSAADSGEIAAYHAYDSRQLYLGALEDTKKALEEVAKAEMQATSADSAQNQGQDNNGEQPQQKNKLQQIESAAEKAQILKEPIEIKITGNFDEINAKFDEMLAKKAALDSAPNSSTNQVIQASVESVFSQEALIYGSRD